MQVIPILMQYLSMWSLQMRVFPSALMIVMTTTKN